MYIIKMSLGIFFHPIDSFNRIKNKRNEKNYLPAAVLFLAVVIVRIASIFIEHFPLASMQPKDTNIFFEAVRMILPLFTWVLACYAINTILDGETLFRETLEAAAFSMLPYIIFTIPVALLSNILQRDELAFYSLIRYVIWTWVIILFLINMMVMNEYSFFKTLGVSILSIAAVFIIWILAILIFALTSQLFSFFSGIALELKLLFMN